MLALCQVDQLNHRAGERYDEAVLENCVLKKELIITPAEIEKARMSARQYFDVGLSNPAMESWIFA